MTKKNTIQWTEKELLEASQKVMFELLELHTAELSELYIQLENTKKELDQANQHREQANQALVSTLGSRSFRTGYIILHPLTIMRSKLVDLLSRK